MYFLEVYICSVTHPGHTDSENAFVCSRHNHGLSNVPQKASPHWAAVHLFTGPTSQEPTPCPISDLWANENVSTALWKQSVFMKEKSSFKKSSSFCSLRRWHQHWLKFCLKLVMSYQYETKVWHVSLIGIKQKFCTVDRPLRCHFVFTWPALDNSWPVINPKTWSFFDHLTKTELGCLNTTTLFSADVGS